MPRKISQHNTEKGEAGAAPYLVKMLYIPVSVHTQASLVGDFHPMSRQKLLHTLKNRPVIKKPAAISNAAHVPFWCPAQRQECFCLGPEKDLLINNSPQKGRNAEAVATSNDPLRTLSLIKENKVKLASKVLEKPRRAANDVESKDQLTITLAGKLKAVLGRTSNSRAIMVIDFSIHDGVNQPVTAAKGL